MRGAIGAPDSFCPVKLPQFKVVGVDVIARRYGRTGKADHLAIAAHRGILRQRMAGNLVARRNAAPSLKHYGLKHYGLKHFDLNRYGLNH